MYDKLITWNGYKKSINSFIKNLPIRNNKYLILDAGCGTGLISYALAKKIPKAEIISFDLSKEMIKAAERLRQSEKNIRFFIGNAENDDVLYNLTNQKFELKKNSFDFIFISGVLEYTNMQKTLNHLIKFLKKDGPFYNIAVRDNISGKCLGKIMDFSPYSEKKIIHAMQKAGFKNVRKVESVEREKIAARIKAVYVGEK